jgi:hypothetical protein
MDWDRSGSLHTWYPSLEQSAAARSEVMYVFWVPGKTQLSFRAFNEEMICWVSVSTLWQSQVGNAYLIDLFIVDFRLEFELNNVNDSHFDDEGCVSRW